VGMLVYLMEGRMSLGVTKLWVETKLWQVGMQLVEEVTWLFCSPGDGGASQ